MTKKYLLRWACLPLAMLTPGLAGAAPVLWTENGHYYDAVSPIENYTWEEARDWAATQTIVKNGETYVAHLATITSSDEHGFIDGLGDVDSYLLGGFQTPPSHEVNYAADWHWVTGEAWGYTNWRGGEPNNTFGYGGLSEEYLQFFSAGWNDVHVGTYDINDGGDGFYEGKGYILEYEISPVPEPATMLLFGTGIAGLVGARLRKKKK